MSFRLEQLCDAICVTEWSSWTICTKNCGGGTRKRTRKMELPGKCSTLRNFRCRHSTSQTGRCNEVCPNGGSPSSNGCSCIPGWKGDCCTHEITCDYPGKPSNGRVDGSWPAKFRSVATFYCNSGYHLVGSEEIVCKNDEKWNGKRPVCSRITCKPPKVKENVEILNIQASYAHKEKVVYACRDGYKIRGSTTRTCINNVGTSGRWSGFDPTCKEIGCGDPGSIEHGERNGTSFKFLNEVYYNCALGYKLSGSARRKCIASGTWTGREPVCQQIMCDTPRSLKNGEIIGKKYTYASHLVFECDSGFILKGNKSVKCQANGEWNSVSPTCQAANCGNPGLPINGAKDGSIYHYPHTVTYSCFIGYVLKGSKKLKCQADGQWSNKLPNCIACHKDTYMKEGSNKCTPCPVHTHTLTIASTTPKQCVCDKSYTGPSGGPCKEIRCPVQKAPDNGKIKQCDNRMGSMCNFDCDSGYILDKGSSTRTCQENGQWDGHAPMCSPCLKDTYKSGIRSCLPCPIHSHTVGIASKKAGCLCDEGYNGTHGGPCQDVNECLLNNGQGSCEDICENRPGSYKCACSIQGHKIDPKNKHTCIVAKQCTNLTEVDAPSNGGLICHWYREENSQQCGIKCNPGYEFPSRTNDYEYCGPATGYTWSYQREDLNATINPCIEEFFPDFRFEANSAYFVRACKDLTTIEQEEVKKQFANKLTKEGLCKRRGTKICDIKNVGIICGRETRKRKRRGIEEELSSVDFAYQVTAFKQIDNPSKCDRICPFLRIPHRYCGKLCVRTYRRFLEATVRYAKRQLQALYRKKLKTLEFEAADRIFEPNPTNTVRTSSKIDIECQRGMKKVAATCVPCSSGTFYSKNECKPCAVGYYQPLEKQLQCVRCPKGTTTTRAGAVICSVCPHGRYGDGCQSECQCIHGRCDPRTGSCTCNSGWEGTECHLDVPGCRYGNCYSNVTCVDIAAPGTGFSCGECPNGLLGDGAQCMRSLV